VQATVETVDAPSAWRSESLGDESNWRITLDENQREELHAQVLRSAAAGTDTLSIKPGDISLPSLQTMLQSIPSRLEGGLGFFVLSGLPVERLDDEQNLRLLWALGLHIGEPEPQDKAGALMHIVTDTGQSLEKTDNVRGFQTNKELSFHTDGADAFALLCVRQGESGGDSRLISSTAVFNKLATEYPELALELQKPFVFDARAQNPWDKKIQTTPIFVRHQGYVSALYKRAYIELAERFDDVPKLSPRQIAALDKLDEICRDDSLALHFRLRPGDLVLANNYSCFHARTEYVDHHEPHLKRRMHRLWLTLPTGRPLPDIYADTREWGLTYQRRHGRSAA